MIRTVRIVGGIFLACGAGLGFLYGARNMLVCWAADWNYGDAWGCTIMNVPLPLLCSFIMSFGLWLAASDFRNK